MSTDEREQDQALEDAERFVRDRGWRHAPFTWQQLRALLDEREVAVEGERDRLLVELAPVVATMPAKWRRLLAPAFGIEAGDWDSFVGSRRDAV